MGERRVCDASHLDKNGWKRLFRPELALQRLIRSRNWKRPQKPDRLAEAPFFESGQAWALRGPGSWKGEGRYRKRRANAHTLAKDTPRDRSKTKTKRGPVAASHTRPAPGLGARFRLCSWGRAPAPWGRIPVPFLGPDSGPGFGAGFQPRIDQCG